MKVSKSVLKAIIKECLIEILVEGLDSSDKVQLQEAARRPTPRQQRQSQLPRESRPKSTLTTAIQAAVQETAKGDNVLADILADTAATTFQNQRDTTAGVSVASMLTETNGSHHKENDAIESPWTKLAFDAPKADISKLVQQGFKLPD